MKDKTKRLEIGLGLCLFYIAESKKNVISVPKRPRICYCNMITIVCYNNFDRSTRTLFSIA